MNFATAGGFDQTIITITSFAVLCAITYVLFLFGDKLVKAVGPSALNVITKMMGLILAVIGTQMFIDGAAEAYKTVFA
ncbi:membrane protein [Vibrio campbellii]|nr:membrane protein [Vibrio campbellii]